MMKKKAGRKMPELFTYLPGPGDHTIMILDHGSSFASIDWGEIGWEEAVRRANLFCASPSMLALLEKALPIISQEAERREDWGERHDAVEHQYATEMGNLRDAILAEINRAHGLDSRDIPNTETCPHGFGFVEYCPDCKKGKGASDG